MLQTNSAPTDQWTIARLNDELSRSILRLFLHRANFLPGETLHKTKLNPVHLEKIQAAVAQQELIHIILPAFPAKSPSPEKTHDPLPDMGELLALKALNALCGKIQDIYTPGAKVTICSDGRVFSDLVMVDDDDVSLYRDRIVRMIQEHDLEHLDTFNLEDLFTHIDFNIMRDQLVAQHARTVEQIRSDVKSDAKEKSLFCGIHRFIREDRQVLQPEFSKNQIAKISKEIAYRTIQRSNAWSSLVEQKFPEAVRLSIHPQSPSSKKLGIRLVRSGDAWRTPWHSVALFDGRNYMLVKRKTAEELGAHPVDFDNEKGAGFYSLV